MIEITCKVFNGKLQTHIEANAKLPDTTPPADVSAVMAQMTDTMSQMILDSEPSSGIMLDDDASGRGYELN